MDTLIKYCLLFLVGILMYSCGVSFTTLSLESEIDNDKPGKKTWKDWTIYSDQANDVWGFTESPCLKLKEVSETVQSGSNALELSWDNGPCDWTGMGIGWDAWEPKDISEVMDYGAIRFQLRSKGKESRIPTMIFLLEDYSGVMCASALKANYLGSFPINENWQTVHVPMSTFPVEERGLDLGSIKQLVIELQGKGDLIIDEMAIVPLPPELIKDRGIKPSVEPMPRAPQEVFTENPKNVWGLGEWPCRNYELSTMKSADGSQSVHLEWFEGREKCDWMEMGISWTSWIAVDMTETYSNTEIQLDINSGDSEYAGGLFVGLQSYDGQRIEIEIDAAQVSPDTWKTINIPISTMKGADDVKAFKRIKQLYFRAEGKGNVFVDNVVLIESK